MAHAEELWSEASTSKQEVLFHQHLAEQRFEELHWIVREGISSSVPYVLNSEEFSTMNATLQSAAIELGLLRDFLQMKIKYSVEFDGKEVLYSYPNVEDDILQRFFYLTNYDYLFLKMQNTGSMDAGLLKKHLEDSDLTTDDD
ncbi:unnamed protein product [Lactuca virosa]|uniref:Uncharacterized protein n=1 Tax=Lactuca virosa TaxID=75947 RepID=A0AAU9PU49_9ASTR|nr:unnamed protein product [Lactuca virosa]